MTFPQSNFEDQQQQAEDTFNHNTNKIHDTFNNTTKTISTAWIVGIVIIVLAALVFGGLILFVFTRNRRRRAAAKEQNDPAAYTTYTAGYQNVPSQAPGYSNPFSDVHDSGRPTHYEAPDTGVTYTEVKKQPEHAVHRSELHGSDSDRQGLSV